MKNLATSAICADHLASLFNVNGPLVHIHIKAMLGCASSGSGSGSSTVDHCNGARRSPNKPAPSVPR
jgi:hypothetical protein